MKSIKGVFTISILVLVVLFTGCKGDDPTPTEQMLKNLMSKAWTVKTVNVNNTDATTSFSGMTLSFTDTNYTTTNGGLVWPATGTWAFTDETATKIKRNDDLEITIEDATGTSLKLSFTWAKTTFGSGRVESVSGLHVFTFQ